jgi:hypothetical protein
MTAVRKAVRLIVHAVDGPERQMPSMHSRHSCRAVASFGRLLRTALSTRAMSSCSARYRWKWANILAPSSGDERQDLPPNSC